MRRPNGLLAAGGGLSVRRLVDAYRTRAAFPWFSDGEPVLWWSPDPRMVLVPGELHVPRSLARRMRRGDITITADLAFSDVMAGCAEPRDDQGGTWITDEMMAAYTALHAPATRTRSRRGRTACWWAGSTAWRSGARSSASRCSRACPTRRRLLL